MVCNMSFSEGPISGAFNGANGKGAREWGADGVEEAGKGDSGERGMRGREERGTCARWRDGGARRGIGKIKRCKSGRRVMKVREG